MPRRCSSPHHARDLRADGARQRSRRRRLVGIDVDANDALQGAHPDIRLPLLHALAERDCFDIVFLAFGTAGPFPKCYRIEDLSARAMDPWIKERSMLSNFLSGARAIGAKTVVPFAGGFALLADRLLWMNESKTTPRTRSTWLITGVLADPDGLETLGISYKLDLFFKAGARAKEPLLDRLIYTPSPLWLLKTMLSTRFAEFVLRRRTEFG